MSGFDALLATRESSLATKARALGLPTSRVESWKYVPTRTLARTAWVAAAPRAGDGFVLSGGQFNGAPADLAAADTALTASEQDRLGRALSGHGFAATHGALESERLVICVPKSQSHTLSLTRLANQAREAGFATLVIRVRENAQLNLTEQFEDSPVGESNLDSLMILIDVARDGRVAHTRCQAANDRAHTFTWIDVHLADNAHYRAQTVDFGGKLSRTDITVVLNGQKASTTLHGLAMTDGSQYHDTHLSVDHAVGETQSAMVFKTLVDGQGEATFNGRVLIQKDAQKSATEQSVANLLLSDKGRINPKPELEIYADDVTASHGCTVGNLNQTELFYLRSRGLSEVDARAFLQYAFAEEIVAEIDDPIVAERVESRLLGALQHGELIAELKESVDV